VNVGVTSDKNWVIADGTDTTPITITVTDAANTPIPGAVLAISLSSPSWGVRDPTLVTNGSGIAKTLFLPTTRSGTAVITVSATVTGVTDPGIATFPQKIDAGTPFAIWYSYPSFATVATTNNLSAIVTDKYGNPVTSLRLPNNVSFVTTNGGSNGFPDGSGNIVKSASILLNASGYATIPFRLDTRADHNYVMVIPLSPLGQSLIDIRGIADSQPFSIVQVVSPSGNPPYIRADKDPASIATIAYYLYDEWGNPSIGQVIDISTSAGEQNTFFTNSEGRATITYGPKSSAGLYFIMATADANKSVSVSQTLQFVSGSPTNLILTASPQTMASLEVNNQMTASVIGKVIDEVGNPVKGEPVTFMIENSSSLPYVRTQDPAIGYGGVQTSTIGAPIPITTDVNGQAILTFYPGKFPQYDPQNKENGYSATAQGTVTVNATWQGKDTTVTHSINLSYKNYPFLSVSTDVIPKTVQVGGAVDVSVLLKGDGWALQTKPIDVVLCTDRSATMLYNSSIDSSSVFHDESPTHQDRMVDAMNAADHFVDQTTAQDRVGVVSFGDPNAIYGIALLFKTGNTKYDTNISGLAFRAGNDYLCTDGQGPCQDNSGFRDSSDDITYVRDHYPGHGLNGRVYVQDSVYTPVSLDLPLTYVSSKDPKGPVKMAIHSLVPAGGTPMRRAIHTAVNEVLNATLYRPESVKAIILLTDGKWGTTGDPRGIATTPSIESYADVAADPNIGKGTGDVILYAKDKGVKIFTIGLNGNPGSTGTDAPIVADLQYYAQETGGTYYPAATGQDLEGIYDKISVALKEEASINTHVKLDFNTVEVNSTFTMPGASVFEYMPRDGVSTLVVNPSGTRYTINDATNWTGNHMFTYDPGTIKVNQQLRMNISLITRVDGNIKVLSSKTSEVTFDGSPSSVPIPDTFITAIPAGTEPGPQNIPFTISFHDPARTNPESDKNIAAMIWDVNYGGKDNTISQQIWIAPIYSEAYQFKETLAPILRHQCDTGCSENLVISDLQPGEYKVKVIGHVSDANDAFAIATIKIPEDIPAAQIKIQ
jgi:hypothetical protein